MRIRRGLLVLLPIVAAVPTSAVLLGTGSVAGAAPVQAPSSALVVAVAPPSGSALLQGATVVATEAPVATSTTTTPAAATAPTSAASPSPAAVRAAARTRAVVARPAPVRTTTRPTATRAAAPAAPKPAPVRTGRDDYPYRTATTNSYDDWGFTKRQCVSFVAWRLAQAGRALDNRTERWGSALNWDDVARQRGKAVTTRPSVGAVAHWQAGESSAYWSPGSSKANGRYAAGSYGHVGWVTHVFADGSVQVEAYNGKGDRSWSTMRVKAPRFLRL